jgi:hypothetical protein
LETLLIIMSLRQADIIAFVLDDGAR